jgi:soluble P-type ATPase
MTILEIDVPGYGCLKLRHLVMDYNGTLALDGQLIPGVGKQLIQLSQSLNLHVVTADTHGGAQLNLKNLPCRLQVLPPDHQAEAKKVYVQQLGAGETVAIGNGRNDRLMLREAALGIAVILNEGACSATLADADMVCTSIADALDMLLFPLRLVAGLRI